MLTLKDKCIRMGRWLHWKEFNCERDIYEDFQFKESAFLDEECKSEKIRLMNKEILILKLRKLQFFLGGVIEWSFFLIHTFVLCLIYFGVSPYFLLLVSPFIICPLQKTISSTIGSVMFLFTGSYLFVCPMLLGVISALSNQNLSQTSVGTGMFISNVILLCVWLYFLVKTDDKITKKIWKARYKEIEQA